MRQFLTFITLALAVMACSNEDSHSPSVPKPGARQIPQVFVLSDTKRPLTENWGFPSKDALTAGLSARVEWDNAKDFSAAAEQLRVWNGRPSDLLIVGPGAPLEAWKAIKLPKVQGRKVVLVGEKTSVGDDSIAVDVAADDLLRFEKGFCTAFVPASKKCHVVMGAERDTLPDGTPLDLNLVVRWKDFLKDVIQDQNGRLGHAVKLNFFAGYLEARKGSSLTSAQDTERFEKMKRDFMLNALSKGGTL